MYTTKKRVIIESYESDDMCFIVTFQKLLISHSIDIAGFWGFGVLGFWV